MNQLVKSSVPQHEQQRRADLLAKMKRDAAAIKPFSGTPEQAEQYANKMQSAAPLK